MFYHPDPARDPNDAYAVIPTPAELCGPPPDWWTVTRNGGPVRHFPPDKRDLAERLQPTRCIASTARTKRRHMTDARPATWSRAFDDSRA